MSHHNEESIVEEAKRRNPKSESVGYFVVLLFIFWAVFHFAPSALEWIGQFFKEHKPILSVIYVIVTMSVAFGMYKFREANVNYYGLTECAFAVITCWFSVNHLAGSVPDNWLPVLAAAFLFVRGLVNFYDDKGKSKKN